MRETALRRTIIAISVVSVILAGLIALVMKLRFIDDVNTKIAAETASYGTDSAAAQKLASSLQAQKIAENNRDFAKEQVDAFRARFRSLAFDVQPDSSKGAREATWRRYLNEYYTDYGVELRRELIQAADESGVIINTSVKVNTPPQNPEDVAAPPSGFLKPLAGDTLSVTVEGTLPNILRFFNRINQMEILTTTGTVSSPGMKLETSTLGTKTTFTLTPYLLATGPSAQLSGGGGGAIAGGATGGGAGGGGGA